jgi:hypothetical protein
MQNWTPVGAQAATDLTGHASNLDTLGAGLQSLIDSVETYSSAFSTAKATHPTPAEIIATRQELLSAMRSKNEPGIAAAMAKFQEQNARSAATINNYASTVGSSTGASATTSNAATAGTTSSTSGSSSGSSDLSSLASMLPLLGMMGSQGLSSQNSHGIGDSTDALSSDGGGDGSSSTLPDIGSAIDSISAPISSSIGDASSAIQSVALGAMPMVAAVSSLDAASLPQAPVTEALSSAAGVDAQAAEAARSGSGMPYMPMMPGGMGAGAGANGGERSRVVAWHPDRLMYVDDTPHTEQVIGEKPTIAPTITPATPLNQSGGTT